MKTTDLDAIVASVPVDKTAARQMSGGIHWVPDKKINQVHTDGPQRMRPVPQGTPDHTGKKYGRLTVIGFLQPSQRNADGPLWQVRCACGQYETRRGKSVRRGPADDCCQQCRQLQFIKRREYFLLHGKNRPGE